MEVMEHLEEGMDPDQLRGVIRYANNSVVMVTPNTSPNANADLVVVDRNTVSRLVSDSLAECWFCEKKVARSRAASGEKTCWNVAHWVAMENARTKNDSRLHTKLHTDEIISLFIYVSGGFKSHFLRQIAKSA